MGESFVHVHPYFPCRHVKPGLILGVSTLVFEFLSSDGEEMWFNCYVGASSLGEKIRGEEYDNSCGRTICRQIIEGQCPWTKKVGDRMQLRLWTSSRRGCAVRFSSSCHYLQRPLRQPQGPPQINLFKVVLKSLKRVKEGCVPFFSLFLERISSDQNTTVDRPPKECGCDVIQMGGSELYISTHSVSIFQTEHTQSVSISQQSTHS
eukprot:sb/3470405/